jgi:hypothetical protein
MADIEQTKIEELADADVSAGYEGFYIPLGKASLSRAVRLSLSIFTALQSATNKGTYINLSSDTLAVSFSPALSSDPVGFVEVYKWTLYGDVYRKEDILWGYTVKPSSSGFTIKIKETVTSDIIVKYLFM